jgi:hypothetical protein
MSLHANSQHAKSGKDESKQAVLIDHLKEYLLKGTSSVLNYKSFWFFRYI